MRVLMMAIMSTIVMSAIRVAISMMCMLAMVLMIGLVNLGANMLVRIVRDGDADDGLGDEHVHDDIDVGNVGDHVCDMSCAHYVDGKDDEVDDGVGLGGGHAQSTLSPEW